MFEQYYVGNATRDPELRFTPSGTAVCNFGLAMNESWTDNTTGEKREKVCFLDVTVWREQAQQVAESITKGMRVVVVGRLEQQQWETPEGDKRTKLFVNATEVAPSLRWATAVVTRSSSGGFTPDESFAPRSSGGGGGGRRASPPPGDEEPFIADAAVVDAGQPRGTRWSSPF